MRCVAAGLAAALLLGLPAQAQRPAATPPAQQAVRMPQALPDAPGLYRRVIVRPGSRLSAQPAANTPSNPIPGFSVFYVYGERAEGGNTWLEVGPALDGRPVGWLPEVRAIAWRQNLVVAFTNPGTSGRERAMFFKEGDTPSALWMDPAGRAAKAVALRSQALAGQPGPVIALEPATHVNIREQFYLLPILAHRVLDNERGDRALRLEVLSAPATPPPPQVADDAAFRNFRGAMVFVIDTTISMGPYIDRTRQVIRDVIARIRGTEVGDRFRFGMVAYRDDMGGNQALEYVTRIIARPNLNAPPDAMLAQIDTVAEATASNDAFDEDSAAGLKAAIDGIDWSGFGGRYLVLITDAGARDPGDPRSSTGLDMDAVRDLAAHPSNRVILSAIHLRTPEGRNNHRRAERQYRALTAQPGSGAPLYFPIAAGNVEQFGQVVDGLTSGVLENVSTIIGRPVGQPPAAETEAQRRAREAMASVGQAVRLSYLGEAQRQTVPDVVRSYVLDQDLQDPTPARKPLDARVLLTSGQLSDISATMRTIVESVNAARLAPSEFFEKLRGAMGATFADPRRLPASQNAEFSSLFGDFLRDLPYRTQFMETSFQEFDGWLPSRRRELTLRLESLMRLYAEYNRERRYWHQIEGNPNPSEAVFPLPIDQLP